MKTKHTEQQTEQYIMNVGGTLLVKTRIRPVVKVFSSMGTSEMLGTIIREESIPLDMSDKKHCELLAPYIANLEKQFQIQLDAIYGKPKAKGIDFASYVIGVIVVVIVIAVILIMRGGAC